MTPKSPKGDFFKLLIFSSSPLWVRGKNGKDQQFEGFLYCTHYTDKTKTINHDATKENSYCNGRNYRAW